MLLVFQTLSGGTVTAVGAASGAAFAAALAAGDSSADAVGVTGLPGSLAEAAGDSLAGGVGYRLALEAIPLSDTWVQPARRRTWTIYNRRRR